MWPFNRSKTSQPFLTAGVDVTNDGMRVDYTLHVGDDSYELPFSLEPGQTVEFAGMSLRDWFAGQALVGDLANSEGGLYGNDAPQAAIEDRAALFYRIADAMLAARKGGAA